MKKGWLFCFLALIIILGGTVAFSGCADTVVGTEGLAYHLLPDGSYSVSCGTTKDLDKIVIPATYQGKAVTAIEENGFADCSNLTEILISNGVTSIGNSAFRGCAGLMSIMIPNSVTDIGVDAFYECTSLQYNEYDNAYYLGDTKTPYVVCVKAKSNSVSSCKIHRNTKVIYDSAFADCHDLTSVTVPQGVTLIGGMAFYGCRQLTSITIPNGVTRIHFGAFLGCTSLTSVTIPDGVTRIDSLAFGNCTNLTTIRYRGTQSQWSKITKESESDWDSYTIIYNYKGE
ncbi:MAG: leucine-rich repeat domain-containing protein [Clostridia bacterium]|nr:leucine-rich repeat domain-containing protein [Clostridia bacterium]